jgi:hypothetical protein
VAERVVRVAVVSWGGDQATFIHMTGFPNIREEVARGEQVVVAVMVLQEEADLRLRLLL